MGIANIISRELWGRHTWSLLQKELQSNATLRIIRNLIFNQSRARIWDLHLTFSFISFHLFDHLKSTKYMNIIRVNTYKLFSDIHKNNNLKMARTPKKQKLLINGALYTLYRNTWKSWKYTYVYTPLVPYTYPPSHMHTSKHNTHTAQGQRGNRI